MIRRRYFDCGEHQIHARESGRDAAGVPLVCLHATAYSSRTFEPLMRAFGERRHVIAIDLPGYGESDPPLAPLDIAGYARAIVPGISEGPIDVFGYHTGVAVAVELALQDPGRVRRLTFMGIPHFRALDFAAWQARLSVSHQLQPTLDQFAERWNYLVAARPDGLSLRRGFENFLDELKAWPDGASAHRALFAYDLEASLARLIQPVTVLNPAGHLAEASRAAAALIPWSNVIELPALNGAVLECNADELAALIPSEDVFYHPRSTADRAAAGPPTPEG